MNFENPLLSLAVILVAGIVGGELLGKLRLPKVTGWIGTGILLRAVGLPGLEPEQLGDFSVFTDFVLGFIAFTVGATLHFASLRNAGKRLAFLLIAEALITPVVVVGLLVKVGNVDLGTSLILGAIAIAGAPGTTVLVVREARARGILTRTLVAAVGLIDMVAVGAFVFAIGMLTNAAGSGYDWDAAAIAVALEFGKSFAIGGGAAAIALGLTRTVVGPAFLGPVMVATILAAWGAGQVLGVSSILACTFAGITVSNLRHTTANAAEAYLQPFGGVLFAGFYTLAGMRLNFGLVVPVAGLVGLFFVGRLVGKSLAAFIAMRLAKVTSSVQKYFGLALLPHGGVAVGLIFLVQADPRLADMQETVVAVGLAALAINQLLGPSATRFAIEKAGEAGLDRPRLLGFLSEQRIVVGLDDLSKADAIKLLTDRLYTTSRMEIPKEEFLQKVLTRESEESTCLGLGFMIPHAVLEEGQEIHGVLGLSSKGLELGAADGRPVHAIVLLATPMSDQQHHLQILAAFASAVTSDKNLREQLYHARSPAHAYEVLHADEAQDLNYFLDDALQRVGADKTGAYPKVER